MKIGIVNFSTSNLYSVKSACDYYNFDTLISSSYQELEKVDALILPGVGSFKEAMNFLKDNNLVDLIKSFQVKEKKIMGICLGFQILFSSSDEFGYCEGLSLVKGNVKKLYYSDKLCHKKIHTGWNTINLLKKNNFLDENNEENYFYFTHSYFAEPEDESIILSKTTFNDFEFCSSIHANNLFGCQFHPEKSGKNGIKIYYDFFKNN